MSDQNKGPIYGVDLPSELPLGVNGWTQVVPRRDELNLVRKKVGDRTVAALEIALRHCSRLSEQLLDSTVNYSDSLNALLTRSGMDLSPCRICGETIICLPDGLACCKPCLAKGGEA